MSKKRRQEQKAKNSGVLKCAECITDAVEVCICSVLQLQVNWDSPLCSAMITTLRMRTSKDADPGLFPPGSTVRGESNLPALMSHCSFN